MAPVTLPPLPGNMTVPPLFGWGHILAVLGLVVLVAVAFFVFAAAGPDARGRSDWEASLEARSSRRRYPATDSDARAADARAAEARAADDRSADDRSADDRAGDVPAGR